MIYLYNKQVGDKMQRYFAKCRIHDEFILDENDIHHIKNVMRMKVSDMIEVVHEKNVYICTITNLEYNHIELEVVSKKIENNELKKHIVVAFPISKEDKMDYILQKCTELGANEFFPINMNRCIVKIDKDKKENKLFRWQKICKEAAEQSKRNIIPKVNDILTIKELSLLQYDLKIICSINNNITTLKNILNNNNYNSIMFVVGPEGDFSDEEEEELINNKFVPVSLGDTTLRMETAPIYVCSCINYENME